MVTLFNVISADGFITRKDGREDFIPSDLWQNFLDVCREHGTLIMGRKTYDAIQGYDKALLVPFEKSPIKKVVITKNREFHPKVGYIVAHSPRDAVKVAPNVLVSSGPTINNLLLREGLVDKIILHELPESIGDGIKPFDRDGVTLLPIESSSKAKGVKVREYRVG